MVLPELFVVHRAHPRQRPVRDERHRARGGVQLGDEHLHQAPELHALAHRLQHVLQPDQHRGRVVGGAQVGNFAHRSVAGSDLLGADRGERRGEVGEAVERGVLGVAVRASDVAAAAAARPRALARVLAPPALSVAVPMSWGIPPEAVRVAVRGVAHRRVRAEIGGGWGLFLSRRDGRVRGGRRDVRAERLVEHVPIGQPAPLGFFPAPQRAHLVAVGDGGQELVQAALLRHVPQIIADGPGPRVHRGRVLHRVGTPRVLSQSSLPNPPPYTNRTLPEPPGIDARSKTSERRERRSSRPFTWTIDRVSPRR